MSASMRTHKVFLAGATGAIGQPLVRLLVNAGYEVFGTTRFEAKAAALEAARVKPIVVDVFDAPALSRALAAIRPQVVIHQLTDLSGLDPSRPAEALARNAHIRIEGTGNLIAAALTAGVSRIIAQSIAWVYAPGAQPHAEDDPLDLSAAGTRAITVQGVVTLERLTMHSPPLAGIVLRYGRLYGPGTGRDAAVEPPVLHVDAAAYAALLALEGSKSGVFNIAEDCDLVSNRKARNELGWDPALRLDN
jgi:nucleoside-diphosphate-sugar epimerase